MREPYRNPRNRHREPEETEETRGPVRRTELYHLANIEEWAKYIFWAIIAGDLMGLAILIKMLVLR